MTEWKTLRVPGTAWEKAREQKKEHDRTWGQQIVRDEEEQKGITREELAEDRQQQLEEVIGAYCNDVATIEHIRELIDQVPDRTASEVEERFK